MSTTALHERIKAACGNRTYRAVAEATGQNSETVRRYMRGHAPSVEFLESLCVIYALNPAWLLTGRGPMHQRDVRSAALGESNPSDLLAALAEALERLIDRVDRIEAYVQMLDVRLRHGNGASVDELTIRTRGLMPGEAENDATDDSIRKPGIVIADAISQRSRPNAH